MNKVWFCCSLIVILLNQSIRGDDFFDEATYDEVKDIPHHPEKYLIDVRSLELVERDGFIPGSIIIPFTELEDAWDLNDHEFKAKYGREKPPQDAILIFSCLDGQGAKMASDLVREKGWQRAKPYMGSWKEWSMKEGLN